MSGKVVIVGLDGATFQLIRPWVEEGKLPNFKRFMLEGVHGELLSTRPPMTCPAWPAFMTGKNPGKFGVCDFIIGERGRTRVVSFADIQAETFWEIAGRSGIRSVIVNVPITYPPRNDSGLLLSGMLTPKGGAFCSDPAAQEDLERSVGPYVVDLDIMSLSTLKKRRSREKLYEMTERRFNAAKHLFSHQAFDLFVVVFQITDIVCHRLWRDPREVLRAYEKADEILGWFAARGQNLFVVSDHGFGSFPKGILVNQLLARLGLLEKRRAHSRDGIGRGSAEIQETRFGTARSLSGRIFRASKRLLLWLGLDRRCVTDLLERLGLAEAVRERAPNVLKRLIPPSREEVDYERSTAYLHSSRTRSIVIHGGSGRAGNSEDAALKDRIKSALLDLRDPETGDAVISKVYERDEIYSGKFLDKMPDLYLEPAAGYLIRAGFGDRIVKRFPVPRSSHEPEGIFLALGPDIQPGATVSGAAIVDVAPTVLHSLGVGVPEDMDGRVLEEVFRADSDPARRRPVFLGPAAGLERGEVEVTGDQADLIMQRLRGLGYLD